MRRVAAAALVGAAFLVAGCGGAAHDLFLVQRGGAVPGAGLALRVTDDGRASCNRGPLVDITSAQLIAARELQRDLLPLAQRRFALPPGRESVLRYRVVLEDGAVRFADDSRGQPAALFRLAKLTRDVARGPCRLAR
ncbi:MAG: hypothetical protein QOH72_5177 [Solirubrobacteraceae bacterium]|nr:hypothetical protein [Solirubrobacteraceae bacterium]